MRVTTLIATALFVASLSVAYARSTVHSDLNGDGKSDLVLQNTKTGEVAVWLMNGDAIVEQKTVATPPATTQLAATGDLDGDSKSDIVVLDRGTGAVSFWKMDGTTRVSETEIAKPPLGWRIVGSRDFNGDGKDDLFFQNWDGTLATWQMDGGKIAVGKFIGGSSDCAVAVANLGGNSLLLYSRESQLLRRQLVSDQSVSTIRKGGVFNTIAAGDFDGDGHDDLIEQFATGGAIRLLSFDANGKESRAATNIATPAAGWVVIDSGDYNGDGKSDILLYSPKDGIAQWQMNGATVAKRATLGAASDWKPLVVAADCKRPDVHATHFDEPKAPASTYPGKGSKVTFAAGMGYLSLPKGAGKKPAIIVIQEWWGVNDWIRQQADRFASQGYVALAVDLYRGRSASTQEEAHELSRALPHDRAVGDLKAAFDYLAARGDVDAKRIGAVGWCLGGGFSLDLAIAEPRLAAAVVNYGALDTDPTHLAQIHAPILGNFGALDRGITTADVNEFEEAMKKAGKSTDLKVYEGAGHAFMNPNNKAGYVYESAKDAWKRIDSFLAKHLRRS